MKFEDWYYYAMLPLQEYSILPGSFALVFILKAIAYLSRKLKW